MVLLPLSEFDRDTDLNSVSDNSRIFYPVALGGQFKDFSHDPSLWSFEQLSIFYQRVNVICRSNALGVMYNLRDDVVRQILCNKWHCDRCRLRMKKPMSELMARESIRVGLKYHIVLTTEGSDYRNEHTYQDSYTDMMEAWNKIRGILNYDAKKKGLQFSYICFPRSQKSGYCHDHILSNYNPGVRRLQRIVSKYPSMGFIKIKSCNDTLDYLAKDFRKDHEWYIPLGKRHFTCSRDIDLSMPLPVEKDLHIMLDPHSHSSYVDQVYDQVNEVYARAAPFDFMLQHWLKKRPIEITYNYDPIPGGYYRNGSFVSPVCYEVVE